MNDIRSGISLESRKDKWDHLDAKSYADIFQKCANSNHYSCLTHLLKVSLFDGELNVNIILSQTKIMVRRQQKEELISSWFQIMLML